MATAQHSPRAVLPLNESESSGKSSFVGGDAIIKVPQPWYRRLFANLKIRRQDRNAPSRFVHFNNSEQNQTYNFGDNGVKTSKYTFYNFLPKFSVEAFSKFANTYFLVVSALQMIKSISITGGIPYNLGPLILVLWVEGVALLIEDRQRKIDDQRANNSICEVIMKDGTFARKLWEDVIVGDIVRIKNREDIPADIFLLFSTNESAVCYVDTKSLDGETNLKLKQGIPALSDSLKGDSMNHVTTGRTVTTIRGGIEYQQPDSMVDSFHGFLSANLEAVKYESVLTIDNLLLRGCTLRNTDYIIGIVLNTGHDTKIMMSANVTQGKLSDLDARINRYILVFVLVEFAICVISAAMSMSLQVNQNAQFSAVYLRIPAESFTSGEFFRQILTTFLLIANLIPVALYVAMKFSRFFQAHMMMRDQSMIFEIPTFSEQLPPSSERAERSDRSEKSDRSERHKHLHHVEKIPFKVRTMDMNDVVGQIDYLFTDKTGTLTTNLMEFRKCCVAGRSYGVGCTAIGLQSLERAGRVEESTRRRAENTAHENARKANRIRVPYFNFIDDPSDSIYKAMKGSKGKEHQNQLQEFFTQLSLCHEVLLESVRDENGQNTGKVRFSAASPDDQALVSAAKQFGVEYKGKTNGGRFVNIAFSPASADLEESFQQNTPREEVFELLNTFAFSSTRRRMSVIVRSMESNEIKLLSKGADDVIFARLSSECLNSGEHFTSSKHFLDSFAEEGLRTLAVAQRKLSEEEYTEFKTKYDVIIQDLEELEKRKKKLPNAIDSLMDEMENELFLVGVTAIEDKLQDRVPETITTVLKAGIKIWMVTGDKLETAMNISYACNLLERDTQAVFTLSKENFRSAKEVIQYLEDKRARAANGELDLDRCALVVEGPVITDIMSSEELRNIFVRISIESKVVVACRAAPAQKAMLVNLVRSSQDISERSFKTLAIGDGANDIPMIQAAHVGVGISGLEGVQAANSADYSFGQFKYLERLLLVHGRSNYRRMSKLILFMFYKNIVLTVAQFIYSFVSGWSGQKFYLEFGLQVFNLVFTGLPSFLLSILDQDLPDWVVLKYPELYDLGRLNKLFSIQEFFLWILNGLFHAFAITLGCFLMWPATYEDLWSLGCVVLTIVILVSNFKIFFEQTLWYRVSTIGWWATQFSWPIVALVLELPMWLGVGDWGFQWLYVFRESMSNPVTWFVMVAIIFIVLIREFIFISYRRYFNAELHNVLQECIKFNLPFPSSEMVKKSRSGRFPINEP